MAMSVCRGGQSRTSIMSREPRISGILSQNDSIGSVMLACLVIWGCWLSWCVGSAEPARAPSPSQSVPEWWSLRSLSRPVVPAAIPNTARISNPIDAFVVSRLQEKGLRQSPEADRTTLLRRLYYDLIGLPPSPAEVEAFVKDSDPEAYGRWVDRLLASSRYGERWARHWLDVVHFGETHGYDKDKPRPNAWPYRDYVIRAFNQDKPYSRFLREQLAGDRFFPGTRDGFEALGFISAGPWDLIGHEEVPESKLDGKVARHLDRDDMVTTTLQTFNSLTVQCAQCHNHKFDPISQEEYYSLQSVFAAVDRADQLYDPDPEVASRRQKLQDRMNLLLGQKKQLETLILQRVGKPLQDLDQKIAELTQRVKTGDAMGYHSAIEKKPEVIKWVQVDLGHSRSLHKITLHPCQDNFNGIGDGFGFPVRYRVEISDDPEFRNGVVSILDRTAEDVPNPKLKAQVIEVAGKSARYLRITAVKLALRQNDYIFALAELGVYGAEGKNWAAGAQVTSLDSIEAPVRWQRSNLVDGWYPGLSPRDSSEIVGLTEQRARWVAEVTQPQERQSLSQMDQELTQLREAVQQLPPQRKAYIGAVHRGGGAFMGTGGQGGKPRTIRVLNRGSVQNPGKEVGPGTLRCVSGLSADFKLPEGHSEGDRRVALADWLASPENPLTWRSIVNRVWQYHFGRGLVETPNDFGRMGALPSHPDLLDWLAVEFRDGGQSLKQLHRLIVTSATYRQSSSTVESLARTDADNRYLWRMNRRKLEAEAVRDAVLAVSGMLNFQMEGPSFQDFVIEKPDHSPHYEYHLHDPADLRTHRRSVYRFIVRSQQQPFMTTLDCADPSMQVGKRNESASPLQALTLLNNALMLEMSQRFGDRLRDQGGDTGSKVRQAYYEALGRPASEADTRILTDYAQQYGWANFCRVLFNLNEFTFVD